MVENICKGCYFKESGNNDEMYNSHVASRE